MKEFHSIFCKMSFLGIIHNETLTQQLEHVGAFYNIGKAVPIEGSSDTRHLAMVARVLSVKLKFEKLTKEQLQAALDAKNDPKFLVLQVLTRK